jgi:hypothetical protein
VHFTTSFVAKPLTIHPTALTARSIQPPATAQELLAAWACCCWPVRSGAMQVGSAPPAAWQAVDGGCCCHGAASCWRVEGLGASATGLQKKRQARGQCCCPVLVLLLPAAVRAGSGPMLQAAGAVLKRYRQNVSSRNVPKSTSLASNWWACHTLNEGKAPRPLDFNPISSTNSCRRMSLIEQGVAPGLRRCLGADSTCDAAIWLGLTCVHSWPCLAVPSWKNTMGCSGLCAGVMLVVGKIMSGWRPRFTVNRTSAVRAPQTPHVHVVPQFLLLHEQAFISALVAETGASRMARLYITVHVMQHGPSSAAWPIKC